MLNQIMQKLSGLTLNKRVPLEIKFVRVLILIGVCLIVKSLKCNNFWKQSYSVKNFKQNLVLLLIIDIGILSVYLINNGCADYSLNDLYNDNLTKALSKGEVSISDTPDNTKLEELNNPYDAIERDKLNRNSDYIWDATYYNQKYYVYFGAIPALILMVPYYLITHKLISSAIATLIFSLLSIPILVMLIKSIFLKYFKELPFKYMAFSSIIMLFGTMLIWINVAPRFYELVTVAGFFFAILGFLLVFGAENKEEKISLKKIFFGCLSLAIAVGCRPTQVFASLLILPILYQYFMKNTNKRNWKLLFFSTIIIPYIIVALLIMRYNYLRFGSPFEFGEKYQLTVNNMKELAVRWSILPTGILCNLFGLPTFQGFFPFIHANGNLIDTFGYFYIEDMIGGVFMISPIAFFCFGFLKILKKSRDKNLKSFVITLLITGLICVSFISLKAGSTGRYLLDFAWIFVLCGIIIFMENFKNLKTEEGKELFGKIFSIIVCYTLIINILSGFCVIGGNNSMKNNSPKKYFDAEYTIMILK